MNKYAVITVVNREIDTFFTDTFEKAQEKMKKTYNDYLEDEEENDGIDCGETEWECWITGNYNNVDIVIHRII